MKTPLTSVPQTITSNRHISLPYICVVVFMIFLTASCDNRVTTKWNGEIVGFMSDPFALDKQEDMLWRSTEGDLHAMTIFLVTEGKKYALTPSSLEGYTLRLGTPVEVEGFLLEGGIVNLAPVDFQGMVEVIRLIYPQQEDALLPVELNESRDFFAEIDTRFGGYSSINKPDQDGNMPLHIAALDNDYKMLGLLLALGANVNAKDTTGKTPLHRMLADVEGASFEEYLNVVQTVEMLLQK